MVYFNLFSSNEKFQAPDFPVLSLVLIFAFLILRY